MDNLFKPYERDYTARWRRGNAAPDPNSPATWPALVIRLPETATAPVVAYDMITGWYDGADKPFKWTPTDWTMEGSVDGVHPGDYGYWLWADSVRKPILRIFRRYGIR